MMRRLLDQIIKRPLDAFVLSMQMLGQRVNERQRIDGMVSRLVHTLSRPAGARSGQRNYSGKAIVETARGEDSVRTSLGEREAFGEREPFGDKHDDGPLSVSVESAHENVNSESREKPASERDTNLG